MSQRNPKLIDMEFAPARERRLMPVDDAGTSHSVDGAASEIRTLMDQLQQTANEARHRLEAVEDERDSLSEQVQVLQDQTRDLRSRAAEAAAMSQQVERLQRERQDLEHRLYTAEEAGKRMENAEKALREAQRQRDDGNRLREETTRERDETRKQREELARSVEALNKTVADLNERFLAGQTQIVNLRQARDATQSQNAELVQKVSRQEDLVADLEYRLETSAAAGATLAAERAVWEAEREDLCRQVVEMQMRLADSSKTEALEAELAETRTALQAAVAEASTLGIHHSSEIEEMKAGRDSALAEAAALRAQVERLRQSGEEGPSPEAFESLKRDRDSTLVQVQIAMKEVIELRAAMQTRAGEIAAAEEVRQALAREAAELRGQFQPLAEERDAAVRMREETLTSLASAQKQIERIAKERDLLRESGTEQTLSLERQMTDTQNGIEGVQRENRELTHRLEAQRLETIDLASRLQAAQEQVRALGASLGEARLLARAAQARPAAPAPAPSLLAGAPAPVPAAPLVSPAPAPAPVPVAHAPFPSQETFEIVRTMRRCYQAYAKDPDDFSHLNELHCAAHTFAEEAREAGCHAVQRLGAALAGLLQELYHFPEQITSEVLTTVVQSIEFLTAVLKVRDLPGIKDPATGTVCVIDDDSATRECIIMALESVMVQILSYREPGEALCSLATTPCDLIFLDIQMPGMDGFEVCSQIRQHSLHKHTPVVFVTGQSGAEVRAKCTRSGGNDFLSKPFILAELALKALVMMVRTEVHLAV